MSSALAFTRHVDYFWTARHPPGRVLLFPEEVQVGLTAGARVNNCGEIVGEIVGIAVILICSCFPW